MATDNQTILAKADMAISDLTGSGGYLATAQAQKFLRILIDESRLMKMATVVPMRSHTQEINKIRFGSRILRAGAEAVALAEADRAKPDLSKSTLSSKLFKAEVNLSNEVLEDSIEQGELRQTVMQLMGEAISRDVEEVVVRGDTASADTFLAQFDGLLKSATSNVLNAGSVSTNKTIMRDMLKLMPSQFLRNKAQLRFLTSVDSEIDYRDSISDRQTARGDKALDDSAPVGYSGIPVMDIPLFPENLGGGLNETNMILSDPKNLNIGIWRKIQIETDKDVRRGVIFIVATMRMDFKFAEETAVVKATAVKVG